jgi:hypothetical protein
MSNAVKDGEISNVDETSLKNKPQNKECARQLFTGEINQPIPTKRVSAWVNDEMIKIEIPIIDWDLTNNFISEEVRREVTTDYYEGRSGNLEPMWERLASVGIVRE